MKSDEEDLDLDERQLLTVGYGQLVPSSAKEQFIRGALSVRLPGALAVAGAVSPSGGSLGAGRWGSSRWGTARRALGALAIGALGFGLGAIVTHGRTGAVSHPEKARPSVAQSSTESSAGTRSVALSELEEELPAPSDSTAPSSKKVEAGRPSAGGEAGKQTVTPVRVTFYEELSYIRRAQTALAAGNPALALGLMRSLSELRSDGALLAERGMTEVLALCALGREGEAKSVGAGLRARTDGSMYVARLDKTCARVGDQDDSSDEPRDLSTSTEQSSRRP